MLTVRIHDFGLLNAERRACDARGAAPGERGIEGTTALIPRRERQRTAAGGTHDLVSTAIQLTSHVTPPSAENACSKRQVSALVDSMTKRTSTCRPLNSSAL